MLFALYCAARKMREGIGKERGLDLNPSRKETERNPPGGKFHSGNISFFPLWEIELLFVVSKSLSETTSQRQMERRNL